MVGSTSTILYRSSRKKQFMVPSGGEIFFVVALCNSRKWQPFGILLQSREDSKHCGQLTTIMFSSLLAIRTLGTDVLGRGTASVPEIGPDVYACPWFCDAIKRHGSSNQPWRRWGRQPRRSRQWLAIPERTIRQRALIRSVHDWRVQLTQSFVISVCRFAPKLCLLASWEDIIWNTKKHNLRGSVVSSVTLFNSITL